MKDENNLDPKLFVSWWGEESRQFYGLFASLGITCLSLEILAWGRFSQDTPPPPKPEKPKKDDEHFHEAGTDWWMSPKFLAEKSFGQKENNI